MTAAKISHDKVLDATIVDVREPITYQEILDIARHDLGSGPTPHLIWLVGPSAADKLTTEEFKDFYNTQRDLILARRGGVTVYVAPGNAENALCRWGQAYVEKMTDAPIRISVVRTLDEAREILTEANAQCGDSN